MLYVTTRNDRDAVTSHRVLTEDRAPDGGFYVPLRHPVFSSEELEKLAVMPFSQRMAEVLNVLFQTKLTRWDVEFSIGRSAVKLVPLRHRIVMGEFWHNPDWCFRKLERSIAALLDTGSGMPGSWARIAIRAAVLAAVSLELSREGGEVDVSALSGDFLWPVSAWYARHWGFPLGSIVICCNENKSLWELICHGQLRTDAVGISTELPEADIAIAPELERLIYGCGGKEETDRYLDCLRRGVSYFPEGQMLSALQEGNYVSVVSSHRIPDILTGVLGTHNYLLTPASALAYGGLLDYRAKKGILRTSLVICESSPALEAKRLSGILGLPEVQLAEHY